MTSICSAIGFR